jgi:hypothetical protein
MQVDTFGAYARAELEHWGREFALHRDCEYLGHQSKNLLAVLIEHQGEMPGRVQGFKPLETDIRAQRIEDIVASIARDQVGLTCVLRAYYCGMGRRKVERWETANLLLAYVGQKPVSQRHYLTLHEIAFSEVKGALRGISMAIAA